MSLRKEQSLFALDLVKLLQWATEQGYEYTIGEVQRPLEMQQIYVKTGRSKTLNSMHLKKCAADLYFFRDAKLLSTVEELREIGTHWETLCAANSWGGHWKSFKDIPHFERRVR